MRRRLTQWLVVVLLTCVVGGHWAVMQGIAWATMLARFSQEMPVAQAVAFTFDGQHPCALCHAVKQGQAAERKEAQSQSPEKLQLALSPEAPILPAPPADGTCFARCAIPFAFVSQPPHPPPRAA
jgi:hypothetical protein